MKKIYWVILTLLWASLTFHLTTMPNLVVAPETWLNTILMDGAHFGFFGVQAVLLYLCLPNAVLATLTTSAFGYWIELLQRTIPGRSYDLMDWALDTLGAIIFTAIIIYSQNKLKAKT